MSRETFKKKTVVTFDGYLNGEDLEFTLDESSQDSEDSVTLESGDITLRFRRADLAALVDHVGVPTPPTVPNAQILPFLPRAVDSSGTPLYTGRLSVVAE